MVLFSECVLTWTPSHLLLHFDPGSGHHEIYCSSNLLASFLDSAFKSLPRTKHKLDCTTFIQKPSSHFPSHAEDKSERLQSGPYGLTLLSQLWLLWDSDGSSCQGVFLSAGASPASAGRSSPTEPPGKPVAVASRSGFLPWLGLTQSDAEQTEVGCVGALHVSLIFWEVSELSQQV